MGTTCPLGPALLKNSADRPITDEPLGYVRSTAAYAASSSRKNRLWVGDPITGRCKPRRDVGRPTKLLTK